MPKIVISGYYGFDNLGDEAVLYSIIKSLKNKELNVEIKVLSNNPKKTSKVHRVDAVSRWKLKEVVKAIKDADMLISGGGSLLQDVTSPKSLIYYLGIITIARILNKKVFFYAQGFGPVKSSWAKKLVKIVLDGISCITLRDEKSAKDLKNLGIKRTPIIVTADPVLGLDKSNIPEEPGKHILEKFGADLAKPMVGFAMRKWQNEEIFLPIIAELADELIKKQIQPIFIPFHLPEDLEIAEKIVSKMKLKDAILIDSSLQIGETLSTIGHMDLMVGMRLHSLIISAAQEIPVIGISYDPKVERFLKSIKNNSIFKTDNVNKDELLKQVKSKLSTGQTDDERAAISCLKKKANKTAELVFDYLN